MHSPTNAAPAPEPAYAQPAGSAMFDGATAAPPSTERPELIVGGAFAGGLLVALILKRLGNH